MIVRHRRTGFSAAIFCASFAVTGLLLFSGCAKLKAQEIDPPESVVRDVKTVPPYCGSFDSQNSVDHIYQYRSPEASVHAVQKSFDLATETYTTPTIEVPLSKWPDLADDLNFKNMKTAIERQLQHFRGMPFKGYIRFGSERYNLKQVEASLREFLKDLNQFEWCRESETAKACRTDFQNSIRSQFRLYEPNLTRRDPRFGAANDALFTGYFTPAIEATRTPTGEFQHPVYTEPQNGSLRMQSRDRIDFHEALAGRDLELFYVADLFSVYMAQIEGGAHVFLKSEGSRGGYYLQYSGTNGRPWRFISRYMLRKHYIRDTSWYTQDRYLKLHPQKQEEIFSTCPSYVYFKKSAQPITGSGGVVLTANRSIALDPEYYPFKGILTFVQSKQIDDRQAVNTPCANLRFTRFSRFYIDQDMGGAIRGKARADLYFGEGERAELAASNEDARGRLYFLMLKDSPE